MRQTYCAKRDGARKLSDQAMRRLERAGGFATEQLERRVLLSASIRGAIPTHVDPATTPQTLFVPGGDAFALNLPQGGGVLSNYYRFSVNNAAPGQLTTFSTSSSTTFIDTAFALYDSDGNLVQISDTDSRSAGAERFSTALNSRQPYVVGVFAAHNILNVAAPYTFTVDTGPQPLSPTITLDATGHGQFVSDSPPNTFAAPADVNYFPIDLTSVGQSATVMLSSVGPDVQLFGQLYRQEPSTESWFSIASNKGPTVSLTATPITGDDVTDAHYLLQRRPAGVSGERGGRFAARPRDGRSAGRTEPGLPGAQLPRNGASDHRALHPPAPGLPQTLCHSGRRQRAAEHLRQMHHVRAAGQRI